VTQDISENAFGAARRYAAAEARSRCGGLSRAGSAAFHGSQPLRAFLRSQSTGIRARSVADNREAFFCIARTGRRLAAAEFLDRSPHVLSAVATFRNPATGACRPRKMEFLKAAQVQGVGCHWPSRLKNVLGGYRVRGAVYREHLIVGWVCLQEVADGNASWTYSPKGSLGSSDISSIWIQLWPSGGQGRCRRAGRLLSFRGNRPCSWNKGQRRFHFRAFRRCGAEHIPAAFGYGL